MPRPDSHLQCKYVYKHCPNARTYKRDGGLHRLCEYHRDKANALQKVYATKRRRELRDLRHQVIEAHALMPCDDVLLWSAVIPKMMLEPLQLTKRQETIQVEPTVKMEGMGGYNSAEPEVFSSSLWMVMAFLDHPLQWLSDADMSDEEYAYLSEVL